MNEPGRHLTDEEIVRLVDERGAPQEGRVAGHLHGCETCRAQIAEVEALLAALRAEPPAETGAELAVQRERILAAVRSRPRAPIRRLGRTSAWLPATTAAAIAALFLWAPRGDRSPISPTGDDPATLPVVVEATRAAEEVVHVADDPNTAERLVGGPSVDLTLPIVAGAGESWVGSTGLEEEFAGLSAADREAILIELAHADFINDSQE